MAAVMQTMFYIYILDIPDNRNISCSLFDLIAACEIVTTVKVEMFTCNLILCFLKTHEI